MGTHAGVGLSTQRNPRLAGKEAAQRAIAQLDGAKPSLVLVFSTIGYDQRALIDSVRAVTGDTPLCGCTGEGVIGRDFADESAYSVGVLALASDELRVSCGIQKDLSKDPAHAGREMGATIRPLVSADTRALIVFPDGLRCNFDRWQSGLYDGAPALRSVPMLGGFAGDNFKLIQTFQFCDNEIVSDGVAWCLLSGSLNVVVAVNHGSLPIGNERTVTACSGNVIQEIDGLPALTVLKEYVDERLMSDWGKVIAPLALGFPAPTYLEDNSQLVLRFMPGRDDVTGSVTIPTEVQPGQKLWMTRRDADRVETGVSQVVTAMRDALGHVHPKFVLQFDCGGRGKQLMREEDKLRVLAKLQSGISATAPWIGFYSFGEIGPVNQVNSFHNYTVVLAAFY